MQVGDVRVAEDADFQALRDLCKKDDGWKQDYKKNNTTVWTKKNDVSSFKLIRVKAIFEDISAALLYDVLHDPIYRTEWDRNMLKGYEICCLNPNNDIGYYALKCPSPLKNRDFVVQRSWLDTGREYYIINHSVNHTTIPPTKQFVRGISYLTGYLITPIDKFKCEMYYVTQSDPKGKLPVWVVNKVTQKLAPKVIKSIHKACRGYDTWKAKNNPEQKPWLFPEQISLPRLNQSEIGDMKGSESSDSIDESDILETDITEDEIQEVE